MEKEKEKIIQALVTIQETCEKSRFCSECPLRGPKDDGYVTCYIKHNIPKSWAINYELWKAFR